MIWRALAAGEAEILAEACIGFDPYLRLGYRAETLFAYFTRPDPSLDRYAIATDGVLAGILCLRRPWLRGPLIETLALLPAAQGRGIGSAVIVRCQAEAGNNLWATVSDFHAPARRFYRRHGFAELCPLPGLVGDGETELLLRWRRLDRSAITSPRYAG
jgi:GNAT superfamily N-acetyltransferase